MAHINSDTLICPYCDFKYDDSELYLNLDGQDTECKICFRTFEISVEHEISYNTYRSDCTGQHEWEVSVHEHVNQKHFMRHCKDCDCFDISIFYPFNQKIEHSEIQWEE